jgi:hypothetical protein
MRKRTEDKEEGNRMKVRLSLLKGTVSPDQNGKKVV